MTEGSSVREHGIKMLSLVEKLEDLQAGLDNNTYINVILQSLPPSYDPFVVNYNMNGLENSINELINMLVQYEATTKKSESLVLVGEASTSKAKGKGARHWKMKKGKAKAGASALSAPVAPVGMGKGKGKVVPSQTRQMMFVYIAGKRAIGRGSAPSSSPVQVLERSKKLSRDEVVLKLGDGKAVAAEAVGIVHLVVSDQVRIELKDCYYVPGMIKNIIFISLLDNYDLIMTAQNKCKMDNQENAQIWHARLGHIFQNRIKRLVDSKTLEIDDLDHLPACESCLKGKMTTRPFMGQSTLASGLLDLIDLDVCGPLNTQARGGFFYFITFTDDHSRYGYVYLMSGEFLDYLKENGILSQWTPPGTPQLNGVSERRNRTLLDIVRSMMSFTELPLSFWGYALETAAKLLNMAPSKTVAQTSYQIWHGKPASYKYLRVWGSPAYVKRLVGDKLDPRSSLCRFVGYPKETAGYYFYDPSEQKVFVSQNAVFLGKGFSADTRREELLLKESNQPEYPSNLRGMDFWVLTGQLDNDPKTYGEAISDIDSEKWIEAIKSEMDSMSSIREVTTFKARLVAKGYTQRPGVDFEETYSPVAMAKSIRIMLAIAAWYDYEIWQMDVKMTFLNGLKQASRSWNIHFDEVIWGYDFIKNDFDPCVYKKDLGEASYILGIKIIRDRFKRMLGMTQTLYVEKVLKRFKMKNSKRGFFPVKHGVKLSKKQSPKTDEELRKLFDISYASAVGSIQTKDMFLVYDGGELILEGYSDASFQFDEDDAKSKSGFVFKPNGGVVAWKSFKHDTTADSTTEVEYIAASEAAKEAVWMKNYFQELGVVPSIAEPVVIFCDNNGTIAQAKEPRSHHKSKHILRYYHLLREIVGRGDVRMD
ncbi:UNVERIFIED_CONTAM: Retrovirus-related Pol polyprotein from transposon TNT 1-94 [Sesamum latifolium]|uniref:Retrovirus-related Pol polyprotein from transposon TNT 1-94 n=1 Tax=Sesamum latifolium TaxID=2727402 RepID=A0AAW2UGP8_9LAMI